MRVRYGASLDVIPTNRWGYSRCWRNMTDERRRLVESTLDILTKKVWMLIQQDDPAFHFFELVWPKSYVPKWSLCMYQAVVNVLPTLDMIQQWNPSCSNKCILCGDAEENTDHLFFNCTHSLYIQHRCRLKNGLTHDGPINLIHIADEIRQSHFNGLL